MKRLISLILLNIAFICPFDLIKADNQDPQGQNLSTANECKSIQERETLTDNWFGLGRKLEEDAGITVALTAVQVYQQNLHGGLSTHRRAGRYQGNYDLELTFDLEKLAGIKGGSVYMLAEGSWSKGIDESSVGSIFGVNINTNGNRSIDVTELRYDQSFFDDKLIFRIGKLDLTGGFECNGCPVAFDGSLYANDETSQFLNGAMVNNPTIPFPDRGLGAVIYFKPVDFWYVAAGTADADADARETGFNTAFHGRDRFFSIYETGIVPDFPSPRGDLGGAYRVGFWLDPEQERLDGDGSRNKNIGTYVSINQMVWKENLDANDQQGLGLFSRWGQAPSETSVIRCFWSLGAQYQGLLPSRDDDVLGFGVAQGRISPSADLTASHETALEMYYNIAVRPWFQISPDIQYIFNPGGDADAGDAVVLGARVRITF